MDGACDTGSVPVEIGVTIFVDVEANDVTGTVAVVAGLVTAVVIAAVVAKTVGVVLSAVMETVVDTVDVESTSRTEAQVR